MPCRFLKPLIFRIMSNITSAIRAYVGKLLPSLNKTSILEDLRLAHTTFSDCQDAYKRALDKMGGKFTEDSLNELSKTYAAMAGGSGKNILANVYSSIPTVLESIELLETVVSGELEDVIATQGLNYKKATLIQLTDSLVFASRMTVKILKYCTFMELNAVSVENNIEPSPIGEFEVFEASNITNNLQSYASVISAMSGTKSMAERLEKIPDILVTGTDFGVLKNTVGARTLEPFDLRPGKGNTNNFTWSPFYQYKMSRLVTKTQRAEEAKNELQVVRMQLYQMENAQRGREDAGTQQQIEILRRKSARLTRTIEQEER